MVGNLDVAPGVMGVEKNEEIGRAVATVFAVEAFRLSRLARNRLTNLADELDWTFIVAPEAGARR
jgi:hypothetical protein